MNNPNSKRFKKAPVVIVAALSFVSQAALAAPCCGGHAAIPTLITGYETFRLNAAFTGTRLIGDAPEAGLPIFRDSENQTTTGRWSVSGSQVINKRYQLGAATSFGTGQHENGGGLGDTDIIGAWEAQARESLLSLTPQVHVFAQLTLPTGQSIHETSNSKGVTGSGFYKFHLGSVATTTLRKWDAFAIGRLTYGAPRDFSAKKLSVSPGLGGDLALGLGYSLTGEWRVGGAVQSVFSEGKTIASQLAGTSTTSSTLVWPVQAQLTWFPDQNNTLTVSYLDETLIGPARNTSLSRSISLQYSYRFANVN